MATIYMYWAGSLTGPGGPSHIAMRVAEEMSAAGADVTLVAQRSFLPARPAVKTVTALPLSVPHAVLSRLPGSFFRHRVERRLLRRLRAQPGSVLWTWLDPPLPFLRAARALPGTVLVRELINVPRTAARELLGAAARHHGMAEYHDISAASGEEELEAIGLADRVIASAGIVGDKLVELGVPADRVLASRFGYDQDRVARPGVRRDNPRPTALFIGRIGLRKGVPTLLKAWRGLPRSVDAELVLLGNVEPQAEAELRRLADGLSVRFAGYSNDVAGAMARADLFVFPTVEEGGPLVTLEAAAAGLPVLTSYAGAARLIRDGDNGRLLDPLDESAWTAAMAELLSDPVRRRAMGERARETARAFTFAEAGRDRARLADEIVAASRTS